MTQPGVEIRPLREMTGRAMFNEVFIDNARVHDDDIIGGLNNGWAAANTTLMAERAGLGTGGSGAVGQRVPGPDRGPARRPRRRPRRSGPHRRHRWRRRGPRRTRLIEARAGARQATTTRSSARSSRSSTRCSRSAGISALRAKSPSQRTGGEPNIAKLMMSDLLRLQREVGNEIIGADGMVMGNDTPGGGLVQEVTLFSPGPSIYGGTDQVQRNIIGERVLGLPKEPGPAKDTPFHELLVEHASRAREMRGRHRVAVDGRRAHPRRRCSSGCAASTTARSPCSRRASGSRTRTKR